MGSSSPVLDKTDMEILYFIENHHGFAGTAEVAEEIDLTTNGAEYRLKKLENKGEIDSRVVSRDKIWYKAGSTIPGPHWLAIPMAILFMGFLNAYLSLMGSERTHVNRENVPEFRLIGTLLPIWFGLALSFLGASIVTFNQWYFLLFGVWTAATFLSIRLVWRNVFEGDKSLLEEAFPGFIQTVYHVPKEDRA